MTRQLRTQYFGQGELLEGPLAAFMFSELRYGEYLLWFIDNTAAPFPPRFAAAPRWRTMPTWRTWRRCPWRHCVVQLGLGTSILTVTRLTLCHEWVL